MFIDNRHSKRVVWGDGDVNATTTDVNIKNNQRHQNVSRETFLTNDEYNKDTEPLVGFGHNYISANRSKEIKKAMEDEDIGVTFDRFRSRYINKNSDTIIQRQKESGNRYTESKKIATSLITIPIALIMAMFVLIGGFGIQANNGRTMQYVLALSSPLFDAPLPDMQTMLQVSSGALGTMIPLGDEIVELPPVWVPDIPERDMFANVADPNFVPYRYAYRVRERSFLPRGSAGFITHNDVYIRNTSDRDINITTLANKQLQFTANDSQYQVLIIHAHGSEAFMPNEHNWYYPTDNMRTQDTNFNVIRVGQELSNTLETHGVNVLHHQVIYDFPVFSGSYSRKLNSIEKILAENPSIQVIVDVHRDAIITANGTIYSAVVPYEGENIAQMMFVMGSDGGGLPFDHWRENLSLAIQLQQRLMDRAPGSMRPILLRNGRFNQHALPGALLLEIGTSGNCIQEALRSARLFGEELAGFLTDNK